VQPLVSVVVPVFNGMPHLVTLTDALLAQTYGNLEIIFTEGGGSDGSADFLHQITDQRVRVIQMPERTSAAENWTAATQAARGDFIKLVCQDDLIYPETIALQLQDLRNHPDAVMAIAQRDIIDAQGNILYRRRGLAGVATRSGQTIDGSVLIRTCYLQGTNVIGEPLTVLFRANELTQSLPWDDTTPLMLDLSMYEKVAPQGSVVIRRESVGAFRISAASWSTRLAKLQLQQTKEWQESYAQAASPPITPSESFRALIARHRQTTMRRLAYIAVRARGSWGSTGQGAE